MDCNLFAKYKSINFASLNAEFHNKMNKDSINENIKICPILYFFA